MAVDSRDFRKALGCFATGVTVVTAKDGEGRPFGVTINAFTSLSLDPPLVAFCLGRNSAVFDAMADADAFVINILAEGQEGLSQHFASRQQQFVWDEIETVETASGVPALTGVSAVVECNQDGLLDGGDHVIVVGQVTALSSRTELKPLIYVHGRYAGLA